MRSTTVAFAAASVAVVFDAAFTSAEPIDHAKDATSKCSVITAEEIRTMGNNSLFTRWRPQSHFIAPAGWMNDPCGPMYDPVRDIYTHYYQWYPEHIAWGNISWGFATSKDLVTWVDHIGWKGDDAQALAPPGFGPYNGLGIFTGSSQPVNFQSEVDGSWTIFYTSVKWLPTSWDEYYHPHTESQSLVTSKDGGKTFTEYANNPVINATTRTAPMYWDLTGFRDPFLEPFPALDAILGVSEPHWYAVFGSGIKRVGPRMPLWTAPKNDLTNWTFLGALWEPVANSTLGPLLSTRSYGFNFEVSNFFALPDSDGDLHYYVAMGAEGNALSYADYSHSALWNEGHVTRRANGSAHFEPLAGGQADWGLGYALTSFNDTKTGRRVQWGWAEEDIIGDDAIFSARQQGFQGAHTLPRHLFVHEVHGVVDHDGSLAASKSAVLKTNADGVFTAYTLGMHPLPEVVAALRRPAAAHNYGHKTYRASKMLSAHGSSRMELRATIRHSSGAVGLVVAASPDGREYTRIVYEPANHTLVVERTHSSLISEFNAATVVGYFYPYTLRAGGREPIVLDVFVDGSLLEVHANGRFGLSTRIYPSMECSTGYGVYVADGAEADFGVIKAWEGLAGVWPERPLNSSSRLVWDTAAQTDNYTWWAGN